MKAIYVALALSAVVALSGCSCNWRARSCPIKPCLNNPCAVAGVCQPACPQVAPQQPQFPPPLPPRQLEK